MNAAGPEPGAAFFVEGGAQLQNTDGRCWQGTYSTPLVNDGTQFKAAAD